MHMDDEGKSEQRGWQTGQSLANASGECIELLHASSFAFFFCENPGICLFHRVNHCTSTTAAGEQLLT
jgi:hypothetical protein